MPCCGKQQQKEACEALGGCPAAIAQAPLLTPPNSNVPTAPSSGPPVLPWVLRRSRELSLKR